MGGYRYDDFMFDSGHSEVSQPEEPQLFDAGDIDALARAAMLELIVASARAIAAGHARQMRLLARFAQLRPGVDPGTAVIGSLAEEIAPASPPARQRAKVLHTATTLTTRLPATLAALERGEIDLEKACAVVEATDPLTDEQAAAVQDQVLERAKTQTVDQLRASLRRAVLRVDPDGAKQRHKKRSKDRRVELVPRPDGMAELIAYLPAERAAACYQRLDTRPLT